MDKKWLIFGVVVVVIVAFWGDHLGLWAFNQ